MALAPPPAPRSDGATVYIGPRPTMSYVFQVVAELNSGAGPVVVKARGAAIAKAVDVAEVVRRRFLEGQVGVGPVTIGTERLTNRDGREANVSSITIHLTRIGELPVSRPPPARPPSQGAGPSRPTSRREGPPPAAARRSTTS
jgi:archaea-specific DNA-binding protein